MPRKPLPKEDPVSTAKKMATGVASAWTVTAKQVDIAILPKTKVLQDQILREYVTWYLEFPEEGRKKEKSFSEDRVLAKGTPAPALVHRKDFLRYFIHSRPGRLGNNLTMAAIYNY